MFINVRAINEAFSSVFKIYAIRFLEKCCNGTKTLNPSTGNKFNETAYKKWNAGETRKRPGILRIRYFRRHENAAINICHWNRLSAETLLRRIAPVIWKTHAFRLLSII